MRYDCGDGLLFVMASAALVATNTASLGVGGEFWLQLADGVRQCVCVGGSGAVVEERICMRMRACSSRSGAMSLSLQDWMVVKTAGPCRSWQREV